MKKEKPSISTIKCSKTPKNFTETWARRMYRPEYTPPPNGRGKSLWGEGAQHNARAEWIEEMTEGKSDYYNHFIFVEPHNWKSGNDKIQNNCLKASQLPKGILQKASMQ